MWRLQGVLLTVLAAVRCLVVVASLRMTRTVRPRVQVQLCIHPRLHPLLLASIVALVVRRAALVATVPSYPRPKVTVQQPQTPLQALTPHHHPVPQPRCTTTMAITTTIPSDPMGVTRRLTKLVLTRPHRSLWRQLQHRLKPCDRRGPHRILTALQLAPQRLPLPRRQAVASTCIGPPTVAIRAARARKCARRSLAKR